MDLLLFLCLWLFAFTFPTRILQHDVIYGSGVVDQVFVLTFKTIILLAMWSSVLPIIQAWNGLAFKLPQAESSSLVELFRKFNPNQLEWYL